jgi:Flp pilus assembly protein TadG
MLRTVGRFARNTEGAVAPTVALSLVALLAAGGIAFDYARLAALDTELQNAADQATLAAASQLDKKVDACSRANAAAHTLVANRTLFANESSTASRAITLADEPTCDATGDIRFYQDAAKTTPADSYDNARFVEISVNARTAKYIFTPIVSAVSGTVGATAFAGMGSAICKIPPLMICNPAPGTVFNPADWVGKGLRLFEGTNSWSPGGFGYLNVGAVNSGSPDQRIALGMDSPNTNCVADAGVDVDTGVSASVLDALNVRFDIFTNGWPRNTCWGSSGCNPAANATKDLMRLKAPSSASCGIGDAEWRLPPDADQYIATNAAGDDTDVKFMGYPMDICHYPAGGSCGTVNPRFGNGSWRRDIYFKTNHPSLSDSTGSNWQIATGLGATATRYDFYRWEQNIGGKGNSNSRMPVPLGVNYDFSGPNNDGTYQAHQEAYCKAPGLTAGGAQPDRRVIVAAVADNCSELAGGSTAVEVGSWIEIFLVQPSIARPAAGTAANDIYAEVIGGTDPTANGAVPQVVVRDVPYLIE